MSTTHRSAMAAWLLCAGAALQAPPGAAMDALRTPEARFENLPGYAFTPRYVMVDDYEGGQLRMHYIDEGPRGAPTVLMLHGNPTWTYLFRELVPILNRAGYRTVVVDYIGMGRSDKPTAFDDYTYDRHVGWVRQLFEQIDRDRALGRVTIFGHDYGTPIGIRLMAEHFPDRFDAFINANASLPDGTYISPTHLNWRQFVRDNPDVPIGHLISSQVDPPLSQAEIDAWYAPYPDARYKMAMRTFPEMVPDRPDRPEAIANNAAWRFMEGFRKPFMTIFGPTDPPTRSARMSFIDRVPGAYGGPHPQLDVTHYAPEDKPEDVAAEVLRFLDDVHHPRSFVPLQSATFAAGFDGFVDGGADCAHDAALQGIRLSAGNGASSATQQQSPMDLSGHEVLTVGFRYVASGMEAGKSFLVEFWDGADWLPVLAQASGKDFANGVEDYGFVRIDRRHVRFTPDARVRFRAAGADASDAVVILDVGIKARAAGAGDAPSTLTHAHAGTFADPARAGEGAQVTFGLLDGARVLLLAVYTYDTVGPPMWLFGAAPVDASSPGPHRVDVVRTRGARFGSAFDPAQVVREAWGSVSVRFLDCDRIELAYASNLPGFAAAPATLSRVLPRTAQAACP